MVFGIDSTTLLAISSISFTAILIVFVIVQGRSSRELAKASEKLVGAVNQLQTTNLIVGQNTSSLTDATRTFSSAVQALSIGTLALARIESEPKLEYVQKKKDLQLGGIEFDLVNKGKGTAHSVKVSPVSAKGIQLGLSYLSVQSGDITVGEARSFLLTSVKQGDLISLTVECKDNFSETCTPQTFNVDST